MIKAFRSGKEKDLLFKYVFFYLLKIQLTKNNSNNLVFWCLCG